MLQLILRNGEGEEWDEEMKGKKFDQNIYQVKSGVI